MTELGWGRARRGERPGYRPRSVLDPDDPFLSHDDVVLITSTCLTAAPP